MKKNIFGLPSLRKTKPTTADTNPDTVPMSNLQADKTLPSFQHLEPEQLAYGCGQSIGRQREHNEDSIFALSTSIGGEKSGPSLGLFIVADGMGGHQFGEVASSTAIRTFAGHMLTRFQESLVDPSIDLNAPVQDLMRSAIEETQKAVRQAAPGSGTTLTAALILGKQMTICHVGDSRAYAIHSSGGGEVLTRDHSLVKRMEELGQISPGEAAIHPQRNVLYKALGQSEILEADIITMPFSQSDLLLLCSDGLWSVLLESNIFQLVSSTKGLQDACIRLVAAANEAGGPDNISVILVKQAA